MKKILGVLALSSILVLALAAGASALSYGVNVGDIITIENAHVGGAVYGGEFIVDKNGADLFRSFCLETNEYISYGSKYKIDDISNEARKGGTNTTVGDPLSDQTKWLYWHYSVGDLNTKVGGYNYNDNNSADALQAAIWRLEDESNWHYPSDPVKAAAISGLSDVLITAANDAVAHNAVCGPVAVLNLKTLTGGDAQDILVAAVPEPGTILLLGAGLVGLGLYGRRRMKA